MALLYAWPNKTGWGERNAGNQRKIGLVWSDWVGIFGQLNQNGQTGKGKI